MGESAKRKISAKAMVADIRSGMDDARLQRKYGLTPEALESVYTKLIKAGALKESDIRKPLAPPPEERPEPLEQRPAQGTPCPSCDATVPEGSDECPVCGIVLSKFATGEAKAAPTLVEYSDAATDASQGTARWLSLVKWLSFALVSLVVLFVTGRVSVEFGFRPTHRDKQQFQMEGGLSKVIEKTGRPADSSGEVSGEVTPGEINPDDGSATLDAGEPVASAEETKPPEQLKEKSRKQMAHSRPPSQTIKRPPAKATYVTGVVRRFTSRDFKKEVVEASKTYPVMFQFYRDT